MLGENLLRVHGPFVKTEEVQSVVNHLKKQGEPEYLQSVTKDQEEQENYNLAFNDSGDELYDRAVSIVCREKKLLQVLYKDIYKLATIELQELLRKWNQKEL